MQFFFQQRQALLTQAFIFVGRAEGGVSDADGDETLEAGASRRATHCVLSGLTPRTGMGGSGTGGTEGQDKGLLGYQDTATHKYTCTQVRGRRMNG